MIFIQFKKIIACVFSLLMIIKRALKIRDESGVISDFREARAASFPFISGDTFRCIADITIDSVSDINKPPIPFAALSPYGLEKDVLIIFVALSVIESPVLQLYFLDWLSSLSISVKQQHKKRLKVIFHNGDKTPDIDFYKHVKAFVDEVFSVNVKDNIAGVTPIPIGLENLHHLKNGLLKDYMNHRINVVLEDKKNSRSRHILCAFNIYTNLAVREPLMSAIKLSRHEWCGTGMSAPMYRKAVLDSFFVISPPGNGGDCHRTWEAIALGAVPVVQRGSLAKSLVNYHPIYEVDNWEEFLALTDLELNNLFISIKKIPITRSFMAYWSRRLLDS